MVVQRVTSEVGAKLAASHAQNLTVRQQLTAIHTFPSAGEPMLVLATISQLIAGSHAVRRTHAINVWQKFRLKI